jgi:hypothetical protein
MIFDKKKKKFNSTAGIKYRNLYLNMKYPQMEPIKDNLKKDYNIIVSKNKVTVTSVTSAYF